MVGGRPQTGSTRTTERDSLLIKIINYMNSKEGIWLGLGIMGATMGTGVLVAKLLGVDFNGKSLGERMGDIADYSVVGINYLSAGLNFASYRERRKEKNAVYSTKN